jgi:hypothetical protein
MEKAVIQCVWHGVEIHVQGQTIKMEQGRQSFASLITQAITFCRIENIPFIDVYYVEKDVEPEVQFQRAIKMYDDGAVVQYFDGQGFPESPVGIDQKDGELYYDMCRRILELCDSDGAQFAHFDFSALIKEED